MLEPRSGTDVLEAAKAGDEEAFGELLSPHLGELRRHSYRMLGSHHDADDAVQDVLLKAWRALPRFDRRSSLRSWLFRIATNTCLNLIDRNPRRLLRLDGTLSSDPTVVPDAPTSGSAWLGPLADDLVADEAEQPDIRYHGLESVELAFVAALQHLTPRQRAVLVLREVLGFSGAETAAMLDTNAASVYSLLQRAHQAVDERLPAASQQQTARQLGDDRLQDIVTRYVTAWERADVHALAAMLAQDAVMTMPPRPTWFAGREAIRTFVSREPMALSSRWHLTPLRVNGQLAFGCYRRTPDQQRFQLHALHVLTLRADGSIAEITAFLHPLTDVGLPNLLEAERA